MLQLGRARVHHGQGCIVQSFELRVGSYDPLHAYFARCARCTLCDDQTRSRCLVVCDALHAVVDRVSLRRSTCGSFLPGKGLLSPRQPRNGTEFGQAVPALKRPIVYRMVKPVVCEASPARYRCHWLDR